MNNSEMAELDKRERRARIVFGWKRNDYVCADCVREGRTQADSTYLDWPADYVPATKEAYCTRHAKLRWFMIRSHRSPLVHPQTELQHLLLKLAEECAEVIQRITKAYCFGLNEVQPGQHSSNEARINYELNDLMGVVAMLQDRGILKAFPDNEAVDAKKEKVAHFMHYAREIGELE
jgi:hypothetical protein